MRRIQLFEFEDLPWFPDVIRRGGTDFLRYFLNVTDFYEPVPILLAEALSETGDSHIVDLCSGGGGSIETIYKGLKNNGQEVSITASDKFPNVIAYEYLKRRTKGEISYYENAIDATEVPESVPGFRTIFSAIHHFEPCTITKILRNAVDSNSGIAIFDGGDKNIFTILGIILFHPIAFVLFTPFFRPFRWSRLVFTYLIPLIPLYTIWDGCVSILRLYTAPELLKMAEETDNENYEWKAGREKNKLGMHVTYLIGYPKNKQVSTN